MHTINIVHLMTISFLALLFPGCGFGDCGDDNHYCTDTLSNGIYVEKYRCFCGGVSTTDVFYVYLTDSTTFRKYVGMDDSPYETVTLVSRNDYIVDVYKNKDVGVLDHKYKTKLNKSYNINKLKKKKNSTNLARKNEYETLYNNPLRLHHPNWNVRLRTEKQSKQP